MDSLLGGRSAMRSLPSPSTDRTRGRGLPLPHARLRVVESSPEVGTTLEARDEAGAGVATASMRLRA